MEIRHSNFIASHPKEADCPTDGRPEFAFIGRSNVGKSSLINMLVAQKGLAKVSGTPGKTQLLNYFEINQSWYLVDLPGYGYARASKSMRAGFTKMIRTYFERREPLACAFVLIDSNIDVRPIDLEFINFMGGAGVPFCILFTKADRSNQREVQANVRSFMEAVGKSWETLPPYIITSAVRRLGREEVLKFIAQAIKNYKKNSVLLSVDNSESIN